MRTNLTETQNRMMNFSHTTIEMISKAISKKNPYRIEAAMAVRDIKTEEELVVKLQELIDKGEE